jgi:hypothetical protein
MPSLDGMRACFMADLRCSPNDTLESLKAAIKARPSSTTKYDIRDDITTIQAVTLDRTQDDALAAKLEKLGFKRVGRRRRRASLQSPDCTHAIIWWKNVPANKKAADEDSW